MYESLYHEPVKLAVLGDPVSPVSEATGQTVQFWNIIMVSDENHCKCDARILVRILAK